MDEPSRNASPSGCPSRRQVLAALGAAGVGTLVAGCRTDGSDDGTSGPRPPDAGGAPTVGRQPLASTHDIPVGGGRIVAGALIVQPVAGQFLAYDVRCPHRAARVSPPQDGVITCHEHGSTFRDVDGARLSGPTPRGLSPIPVGVEGTTIVAV